jgi:hypothetical protein
MSEPKVPTAEQIGNRAYEVYLERGGEDGPITKIGWPPKENWLKCRWNQPPLLRGLALLVSADRISSSVGSSIEGMNSVEL